MLRELDFKLTRNDDILTAASNAEDMNYELVETVSLPEKHEIRSAKAFVDRQSTEGPKQSICKS